MSSSRPNTGHASPRRPKTSSDGFTLLELLVALTIFSLVIGMAMFSLRFSFGVFRHLDAPYVEETRNVTRLRDCIASAFVYVGERSDLFNRNKEFYTCFSGEGDQITFVSTKPLSLPGPALCRLHLKDKALVLDEAPLYASDGQYLNPSLDSRERRETVLLGDVSEVSFAYFQGDKQLSSLKEELPTMVKVSVKADDKQREIYCRLQSDYNDKKSVFSSMQQPL
jgi:prepilin-type N-terminal cleavage/methylation domain-containing protein